MTGVVPTINGTQTLINGNQALINGTQVLINGTQVLHEQGEGDNPMTMDSYHTYGHSMDQTGASEDDDEVEVDHEYEEIQNPDVSEDPSKLDIVLEINIADPVFELSPIELSGS